MSSTSFNVASPVVSLSCSMLSPPQFLQLPMDNIASIPTVFFVHWVPQKRTTPLALLQMKLYYPVDNLIASSTPPLHRNHRLHPPLRLHLRPPLHYTDSYPVSLPNPPSRQHPSVPGSSTSTPWTTSSRGSTTSTLSSTLDRSHQHSLDGRGLLHGHLWQATRFRPTTPLPNPLTTNEDPSPPPPATTL